MSEVIESSAAPGQENTSQQPISTNNHTGSKRKRNDESETPVSRRGGESDDPNGPKERPRSQNNSRQRDPNRRDSSRNKRNKRSFYSDEPPRVDDGTSYKAKMNRNYHNSIFIGNLPYNCTGEDLTDGFNRFGQVIRSDIVTQKGRHRGMGTVEFRDYASVVKAIRRMNNETFMGRVIFVRKDNPPPEDSFGNDDDNTHRRSKDDGRRDRTSKKNAANSKNKNASRFDEVGDHSMSTVGYEIFAANLPFSTKARDLYDMFSKFGTVHYAKVVTDREGRSRGYGVCNMDTKEQAMSVLQFCQNLDIDGRKLDCKVGKIGWTAQPNVAVEPDSSANKTSGTDENYAITESELTERELIKQREAERSLRDQGTFSFMDDILNGGTGITKVATPISSQKDQNRETEVEKEDTQTDLQSELIETNNAENEPLLSESRFILIRNFSTVADHNDIVELCQSFGHVKSSSRDPNSSLNEEFRDHLPDRETIIVEFDEPVTEDSCIKVLNGFTYAGKELHVQLYSSAQ